MSSFPLGSRAESEDRCLGWLSHFKQCLNGLCCRPAAAHCKNRENIKRWADRDKEREREREENLPRGRSAGRAGAATVQREGGQEDNGKRPLSDNESDVPSLAARARLSPSRLPLVSPFIPSGIVSLPREEQKQRNFWMSHVR